MQTDNHHAWGVVFVIIGFVILGYLLIVLLCPDNQTQLYRLCLDASGGSVEKCEYVLKCGCVK